MKRPVIGINMDYVPRSGGPPDASEYALRHQYADAVLAAGGLPWPIPCFRDPAAGEAVLERVDGLLFSGSDDYPPAWYGEAPHPKLDPIHDRRAVADRHLAEAVLARRLPSLWICGGLQLLCLVRGGRLIQHLDADAVHGGEHIHPVQVEGGRWLRAVFGRDTFPVNSKHHQAADPARPGRGLLVAARAPDGVIEALEPEEDRPFTLAVQWHPERIADRAHREALFGFFIAAAARTAAGAP